MYIYIGVSYERGPVLLLYAEFYHRKGVASVNTSTLPPPLLFVVESIDSGGWYIMSKLQQYI